MYLVYGSTGYVGKKFTNELIKRNLPYVIVRREDADYYDFENLTDAVRMVKPKFIINCAGYVGKPNVDACEDEKEETLKGNMIFPHLLSKLSVLFDVPFAHVSSGCIYTGTRADGKGFTEEDPPNFCFDSPPCSYYSGSKAEGEKMIKAMAEKYYIWRLRIPFDENDNARNYLSKLQRYEKLLNAENSISHLGDFVNACIDCLQKEVPFGIYNIINTGSTTTKEVVKKIKKFRPSKKRFKFWADDEEFYKLAAKTPRSNCVMDNSKLLAAGIKMRSTEEALEDSLKNWRPE